MGPWVGLRSSSERLNRSVLYVGDAMTELIKRLREADSYNKKYYALDPLHQEAADRIEELEAKLATCEKYRDAYAECDRIGAQAVRDLEAKLTKAVEVLRHIFDLTDDSDNMVADMAREALAELEKTE